VYASSLIVNGTESSKYFSDIYNELFILPIRVKKLIIWVNSKYNEIDSFIKQLHSTTYKSIKEVSFCINNDFLNKLISDCTIFDELRRKCEIYNMNDKCTRYGKAKYINLVPYWMQLFSGESQNFELENGIIYYKDPNVINSRNNKLCIKAIKFSSAKIRFNYSDIVMKDTIGNQYFVIPYEKFTFEYIKHVEFWEGDYRIFTNLRWKIDRLESNKIGDSFFIFRKSDIRKITLFEPHLDDIFIHNKLKEVKIVRVFLNNWNYENLLRNMWKLNPSTKSTMYLIPDNITQEHFPNFMKLLYKTKCNRVTLGVWKCCAYKYYTMILEQDDEVYKILICSIYNQYEIDSHPKCKYIVLYRSNIEINPKLPKEIAEKLMKCENDYNENLNWISFTNEVGENFDNTFKLS
jgi:hypothetical protein